MILHAQFSLDNFYYLFTTPLQNPQFLDMPKRSNMAKDSPGPSNNTKIDNPNKKKKGETSTRRKIDFEKEEASPETPKSVSEIRTILATSVNTEPFLVYNTLRLYLI